MATSGSGAENLVGAAGRPEAVGVILRDGDGAFYAIAAGALAACRVAEEQWPLVEALIRGEDVAGFGGQAGEGGAFASICRSLQDDAGGWSRSLHLTHVAASLWLVGR